MIDWNAWFSMVNLLALIAWTGMRGIVSLASALGLPLVLSNGAAFPYRDEIIIVTMVVVLATLVVQGLTLSPVIRRFAFVPDHAHFEEEHHARREALRRGVETLDDLSRESWTDPDEVDELRREMRERVQQQQRRGRTSASRRRLRMGVIQAERRMLVRLRNEGAISDETLRELEEELDHESVRVGAGDER